MTEISKFFQMHVSCGINIKVWIACLKRDLVSKDIKKY